MRKLGIAAAFGVLLCALTAAWLLAGGEWRTEGAPSPLQVVCIATQNDADSTLLIQPGKAAVLIDAGEDIDAAQIAAVLSEQGVTRLDALVLTHFDKDHIGGAKAILEQFPTDKVVQSYAAQETEQSALLQQYLVQQGIPTLFPTHTRRLTIGDMRLILYPPLEKHYASDNNASLTLLVQHGEVKLFFAGDAENKRSLELLRMNLPAVSLYHVAHHGRSNNATTALFEQLHPAYAVVTAASADEAVLQAAEACGTKLYYTEKGNVVFDSDTEQLLPREEVLP